MDSRYAMGAAILGALAAGCAAGERPTARSLPRAGEGEVRMRASDPRVAGLGRVDCAASAPWSELDERISVTNGEEGLCVTSHRPVVGRPAKDSGSLTIRAGNGKWARVPAYDVAEPRLFGYCRIDGKLRSVWLHSQSACLPEGMITTETEVVVRDGDHAGSMALLRVPAPQAEGTR